MSATINVQDEVATLIRRLADRCLHGEPLGSISMSVFSTAWVSMVHKQTDGGVFWLFPQSFQFLLDKQSSDGSWENGGSKASDIDSILNTMAALLSLLKHRSNTEFRGCTFETEYLDTRIKSGTEWLSQKLQGWDVARSEHVAFEILIPAHLDLLQAEGVEFQFAGSEQLKRLNAAKMTNFTPELLYSTHQTTMIHSLEAFVGKVDFNRLKHRLESGSMMFSPSSTAAYLMNTSVWDDEAEAYLQMVLDKTEVSDIGGFPDAYPSEVFDISWVLSTLLGAGFSREQLGMSHVESLANHLELVLRRGGGVTGFTLGVMPDADDTSKSILSLQQLGRHNTNPDQMVRMFDSANCFRTYQAERNSSFSANCNVLMALLHFPDSIRYSETIHKVLDYLCTAWFTGTTRDKWNASEQYSYMLLAQGLILALSLWDRQALGSLPTDLICHRISLVLAQILSCTLLNQQKSGSWGSGSCEITAYSILTLKDLLSVPFLSSMAHEISTAIEAGRQYLVINRGRWADLSYIWVEKVMYGSALLAQTYCLAAMHNSKPTYTWTGTLAALVYPPMEKSIKYTQFFSRLPLYSHLEKGNPTLKLSVLEGYLLLPRLKALRLDIFPRKNMAEDKWLEYIPLTWTCCNYLNVPVNTELVIEMMILSMLNYQADEYMEAVVGTHQSRKPDAVQALIHKICAEPTVPPPLIPLKRQFAGSEVTESNGATNGTASDEANAHNQGDTDAELTTIEEVLTKYTTYIVNHRSVRRAPARTRTRLRRELATFLSAHVTQNSDNELFAKETRFENNAKDQSQPRQPFTAAHYSFYQWVRTTSADHTSGPFSWIFYECLIGKTGEETWKGAKRSYLAEEVGRRLSTMCRMYNDYGSAARDRAETNVNSLDFPEFFEGIGAGSDEEEEEEDRRKADLMYLAEYERECLNRAISQLGELVEKEVMKKVRLFVNVTDLYGQIYVARDIASRMK